MHIPETLARRLDHGRAERALLVERSAINETARTATLSFASEAPYERAWGVEILDCAPGSIRQNRLASGANLLCDHDPKDVIGVVESIQISPDRVARAVVRFGKGARAEEVWQDVRDGIRRNVSVGYLIHKAQLVETEGGLETYRVTDWEPFEVSLVSIPADASVGVGRSDSRATQAARPTLSLKKPTIIKEPIMENQTTTEDRNHAAEIARVAATLPNGAELAMRSIQAGHTVEQFQQEAIRAMSNKPLPTAGTYSGETDHRALDATSMLRTGEDFRRHYSQRPDYRDTLSLAGFLRGVARMKATPDVVRALSVGVDASGGYAVPSAVMPRILEAMVPESSLLQAGAAIVPLGDAKSFSFAAVDTIPAAGWRAENGLVAESGPTFRNVLLTPRSLSFVVKVSRELLADGINVDAALQVAIAQAFAVEMDRAGLRGSGAAPEIRGLLNVAGVQTVTNGANGAPLSGYANFFAGAEKLMEANAPMPGAAIMSPRSRVKLGALVDTTGQPLQVPGMLAQLKLLQTSQVPNNLTVGSSTDCSEIYLGDFTQFVIGMREQVSIQVLEEAFSEYGQIGFMCHARLDVAALYPKAFCIVSGVR